MSRVLPIIFVLGAYVALPVVIVAGWVRLARRRQADGAWPSVAGLGLGTVSALLAIGTMLYARTVGPSLPLTATCDRMPSGPFVVGYERLMRLNKCEAFLVVAAKLRYNDVFGHSHETKAAYEYHPDDRCFHLATHFNRMT